MTATQFRETAGTIATKIATSCGYSTAYWSDACRHGREIPLDRLACMTDALETHIKQMQALVRTMRREVPINQRKKP